MKTQILIISGDSTDVFEINSICTKINSQYGCSISCIASINEENELINTILEQIKWMEMFLNSGQTWRPSIRVQFK